MSLTGLFTAMATSLAAAKRLNLDDAPACRAYLRMMGDDSSESALPADIFADILDHAADYRARIPELLRAEKRDPLRRVA